LKYKQQIEEAYGRLGYSPRPGQLAAVDQIVSAHIDDGMESVVLCAPTGTGKSIIGLIVAEVVSTLRGNSEAKSSIILSATNMLLNQYDSSFSSTLGRRFIMIKGASNYSCSALSSVEKQETAESCAWFSMVKAGGEFTSIIEEHCNSCDYFKLKEKKNSTRHLTTNYSYFFIDRLYSGKFEKRDVVIWDEAHLVNDLFSEHNAIHFSQRRLQAAAQEIADAVRITDIQIGKTLTRIAADCAVAGKITDSNYKTYCRSLMSVYEYAVREGSSAAAAALRSRNMNQYNKLSQFVKKYEGLLCKIDDLFKFDYDHVFEYRQDDSSVSVKPIFVGKMARELTGAGSFNLFMSATVNLDFMCKTLHLDREKTRFIKLDPTFAKENKEVVFFNPISLSYTSLQSPKTVQTLRKNVLKIVKKHLSDEERGIVLTPSFKLQAELVAELTPLVRSGQLELFEHRQGEKLETALSAFKSHKGSRAVLISPSMYEGIDLPGNLSRYQIFVKAPFPSLGDKRMKFILENHPDLYELITIKKCIQGAGRSVRSADDHAVTYMLDTNAQRLMNSGANIWKDEFTFKFSSMF
jgi:Rad3-related DNA helicase